MLIYLAKSKWHTSTSGYAYYEYIDHRVSNSYKLKIDLLIRHGYYNIENDYYIDIHNKNINSDLVCMIINSIRKYDVNRKIDLLL